MKRLAYIVLSLLVLVSCTSRQEYAAMRQGLDSINELNHNDEPFTVSDVQPYVEYFNHHGEPNDRMLSHYLLGRAYHEQGEAPMALDYYQKAIECADTTSNNCDFKQLSRVHSQMGSIFYSQLLYREHLIQFQKAEKYAWMGHDTLAALINYEQQGLAYQMLAMSDSAVHVIENVSRLYMQYGYSADAAIALGSITRLLINMGNYEKAKEYMIIYESRSGLFNQDGEIEHGREAYYNTKGLLYYSENNLDSASYWYRKELTDNEDFNNQNGGALGLAMVYVQRHIPDSAAKYYHYAYAMNDSMYAHMTTEEVERMQAMYDYSRHQEIAFKEKRKASQRAIVIWICIGIIILITLLGITLYSNINRRRRELELKYVQSLKIIRQARQDIIKLETNKVANSELITEKEQIIHEQKDFLNSLSKKPLIYKQFAVMGKEPSSEEWEMLQEQVFDLFPNFHEFMNTHLYQLNDKEYKTCILIRAGFKPKNISDMLGVGPSYISNIRTEMLQKLYGLDGSPKEFDKLLKGIC